MLTNKTVVYINNAI